MIQRCKYYLDVFGAYFRVAMLSAVEYRAGLWGWLLANPIQFIVGFATIKFVVAEFGDIAGWGYGQLAFLYGLSAISHGLNVIFFIQSWFLGWDVVEGEFDRLMLRPLNVLYQYYFTGFNPVGITDMIPGICVFIYGCIKTGFVWNFKSVICILSMLIGATLIRCAIYLILGSISFWTKSHNNFSRYTQELFDKSTMYPLSIYPESFQFILTYLIPIGWVSFYPVSELLGMPNGRFAGNIAIWGSLVVGVLVFAVAAIVFNRGLRHYESAGN